MVKLESAQHTSHIGYSLVTAINATSSTISCHHCDRALFSDLRFYWRRYFYFLISLLCYAFGRPRYTRLSDVSITSVDSADTAAGYEISLSMLAHLLPQPRIRTATVINSDNVGGISLCGSGSIWSNPSVFVWHCPDYWDFLHTVPYFSTLTSAVSIFPGVFASNYEHSFGQNLPACLAFMFSGFFSWCTASAPPLDSDSSLACLSVDEGPCSRSLWVHWAAEDNKPSSCHP